MTSPLRIARTRILVILVHLCLPAFPQTNNDTLNYRAIYSMALKGEINEVLTLLDTVSLHRQHDIQFMHEFRQRFAFEQYRLPLPPLVPPDMRPFVKIFQNYWRRSLLEKGRNYDSAFKVELTRFLKAANQTHKYFDSTVTVARLPSAYAAYIRSHGLYATDFGKTGFLYDLIAWDTMNTVPYDITLTHDRVSVNVNFIDTFVSLGWLSYARMGRTSPGGWATKSELYCVTKGYDTTSEKFHVSFLKHEGQHFADYKNFGDLPSADLEYRAKLQELHYAKTDLLSIINSFTIGARYDTANAHPFANFCVIRDLSAHCFGEDFVKDATRWATIDAGRIRDAALQLFVQNTARVRGGGRLK